MNEGVCVLWRDGGREWRKGIRVEFVVCYLFGLVIFWI